MMSDSTQEVHFSSLVALGTVESLRIQRAFGDLGTLPPPGAVLGALVPPLSLGAFKFLEMS